MQPQHPLRAAVPYLKEFRGKTFVVKVGGEILESQTARKSVSEQLALLWHLGIKLVVVHGGGAAIDDVCTRLQLPTTKVAGRRITSPEVLKVVKMVVAGDVHVDLTAQLRAAGLPVCGVSGVDTGVLRAQRRPPMQVREDGATEAKEVDFGLVGDLVPAEPTLVHHLLAGGFVPLVAPLAGNDNGEVFNTNADTVAASLAGTLRAEKLIFMLAVPGLMRDPKQPSSLVPYATARDVDTLIAEGVVTGGMRPKLAAALTALEAGVGSVHLVSGMHQDALLGEIFTNEGSGTMLRRGEKGAS
ncbi:MAG: acetylglutamate kinase [Myxococcota bacterium]|nr:acetylglutamate kinase [Myxococcota bacterium]